MNSMTKLRCDHVKVDQLDLRVITALVKDGRISKVDMSEQVGLSATPCWERMKKLEKAKVIRGYHADVDLSKLFNISYFRVAVTIKNYSVRTIRKFEGIVKGMPEVVECESVLGTIDYTLKIASADIEAFQQVMENLLMNEDVVFDYKTFPISKCVKSMSNAIILEFVKAVTGAETA